MRIVIENCSSPGAMFTPNTDFVIDSCYDWTQQNPGGSSQFVDFRKTVSQKYNFNDNNARNIFPLLKNLGFISYEKGHEISFDSFFTSTGEAYAKCNQAMSILKKKDELSNDEKAALKKFELLKSKIICKSLPRIIGKNKTSYSNELMVLIESLKRYKKINRIEFAYMLHLLQSKQSNDIFDEFDVVINQFRNGVIQIEVKVKVRNDNDIKDRTGMNTRLEDISYLTSYSYFIGLLLQAGLVKKDKDYICVVNSNDIEYILEVCKDE